VGRYELKVIGSFSSAHSLREYEGNCERVHGHNWKVEIVVSGKELDDMGIALDFRELKRILKEITGELDHRNLNEIPPFDRVNPSSENIARFIFERARDRVPLKVKIERVTVWESENSCASFIAQE
jgi:6-pyruvoyltetrahydropterin/6-carboxytetrahydropterin synthase